MCGLIVSLKFLDQIKRRSEERRFECSFYAIFCGARCARVSLFICIVKWNTGIAVFCKTSASSTYYSIYGALVLPSGEQIPGLNAGMRSMVPLIHHIV
jgi:hypothetical protein